MKVIYATNKVEKQCNDIREATKLFGGNKSLAVSLLARINAIKNADVIHDIIVIPPFHFHKLQGKLEGYFAIDVKSRRDKWRIIIQPLDDNEQPFVPCNIDEISFRVKIVEIREVSSHYE